ncbi:hypothetical protein ETAA8_27570 [Anatilimnocola aggregata]|uniref:Uncharacterized protein n=1 Tax=Anatilimnocola aggregata TaxID=2528021 RepID=A0A517YBP4_9BACT|nr:hypothetical protein [Anatilimnocola aggregata]QDU27668.1 hypothetical protein ETAA8_27570 [Anatilimnocola aggregata]
MVDSGEMLKGLSDAELAALADGLLAPSAQTRLNGLLSGNSEGRLSPDELLELDFLLARVDQLNILKTRARFTLRQQATGTH